MLHERPLKMKQKNEKGEGREYFFFVHDRSMHAMHNTCHSKPKFMMTIACFGFPRKKYGKGGKTFPNLRMAAAAAAADWLWLCRLGKKHGTEEAGNVSIQHGGGGHAKSLGKQE